tara:strand:- start:488 stop:706 length:219 start_codon:yes stop_codon:yes gene_type:complete
MLDKYLPKLAIAMMSREDREIAAQAMVDMEDSGIPVVSFKDLKSHQTSCPETVEVTKQSQAVLLLSRENRDE